MNKCPWQPITEEIYHNGNKTTQTSFGNCLEELCPWWKAETILTSGLIFPGCCMRPKLEHPTKII